MSRFTALRYLLLVLALVVAFLARVMPLPAAEPVEADAAAKETAEESKFLRLVRNDDGEVLSMDTAIVDFQPAGEKNEGVQVTLVGVVHIGEKQYYEALEEEFDNFDVVLYELVAPEGTRVPKDGAKRGANPLSMMQNGMQNMLGLEYQLDQIDYQRENFVHADMSPEEFNQSMDERGDNFVALFFRMIGRSIAQQARQASQNGGQSTNSDADLLLAMLNPQGSTAMKKIMAEQFEDLEGAMSVIEGPDGSTLISERNKKALGVLAEQIKAGKKKIAVFYGAGHMPDMAERLADDFGLQRGETRWLKAWVIEDEDEK